MEIVNNITELLNLPTLTPMRLAFVALALFLIAAPESWKAKVFAPLKAAFAKLTGKTALVSTEGEMGPLLTALATFASKRNKKGVAAILEAIDAVPEAAPVETPNV